MASEFLAHLPAGIDLPLDPVGDRLLREYGAVFVTAAVKPTAVIFKDEREVTAFQSGVNKRSGSINGIGIALQAPAYDAYLQAAEAAAAHGLAITPRGQDSSSRSYAETVSLWRSRVEPGLDHWIALGEMTETEASRIRSLSPFEQVPVIFSLEERGLFFAKDLTKSIIYSVAPPGASQHISMLALDIAEHDDQRVRNIMSEYGWHQTVVSDLPHFTFLGYAADHLGSLGLRSMEHSGRHYWLPAI